MTLRAMASSAAASSDHPHRHSSATGTSVPPHRREGDDASGGQEEFGASVAHAAPSIDSAGMSQAFSARFDERASRADAAYARWPSQPMS